jgi:hypothetical protein
VAPGQRIVINGGRPGANRLRRGGKSQACLNLVRKPAPASASPSELRGLTQQFGVRKVPNGPAMRPVTPLAVENGVGKLAALHRKAPNASTGKSRLVMIAIPAE